MKWLVSISTDSVLPC